MSKTCFSLNLDNYKELVRKVQEDPGQGKFRFTAKTTWKDGTVTETVARDRVIAADELEDLLRSAERTSPMYDNILNGVPIESKLEVVNPAPA